jgi:hypothetical protein
MLSINDFLPQVHLNDDLAELVSFQIDTNKLLHQPADDKFAIIGILIPDESVFKPTETAKSENYTFKYEFSVSVATEVATKISTYASTVFSKKFPFATITQPTTFASKLIVKLNGKVKPDISLVNEENELVQGDCSKLLPGGVVLVEGTFKPYHIASNNPIAGVLLELNSLIVLGVCETTSVASPTKRKLCDFLEARKKNRAE